MSEPLSTPEQMEAAALRSVPLGSRLSWKCSYLQVRDEDQTLLRLYYSSKISAWTHDSREEKGAMFTAAPHCNFQARGVGSVEVYVETCTRWRFDTAFGGVYELWVIPAFRHRLSQQAQTFIKQVNKKMCIPTECMSLDKYVMNRLYKWGPISAT